MEPKEILHPGLKLKSIKPEALRNSDLAEQLGICRTSLWLFMNGKRRLRPDWAPVLAKISDKSAREWIEDQAAYDVHRLGRKAESR